MDLWILCFLSVQYIYICLTLFIVCYILYIKYDIYILHVYNHYRLIGWWFLFVLSFCLVKILLWLDQEMHKMCPDISVWVLRTNSLRNCGAHCHRYLQIFIIWAYYRDSQLVTPNGGDFWESLPRCPVCRFRNYCDLPSIISTINFWHPAKKAHQSDVFETRTS